MYTFIYPKFSNRCVKIDDKFLNYAEMGDSFITSSEEAMDAQNFYSFEIHFLCSDDENDKNENFIQLSLYVPVLFYSKLYSQRQFLTWKSF